MYYSQEMEKGQLTGATIGADSNATAMVEGVPARVGEEGQDGCARIGFGNGQRCVAVVVAREWVCIVLQQMSKSVV